ncbi:MAG: hypothetical protein RIQ94_3396 [Pseudomonadota bacterium]|jgi:IS30 family transposase
MAPEICALIEEKIRLDFSPEQVSGWLRTERDIKSVMNGYTNMSGRISVMVTNFINTYATVIKSAKRNTGQRINVERLETESALMNDLRLSNKKCGLAIGR